VTLVLILSYLSIAVCAVIGASLMQVPRLLTRAIGTLVFPRRAAPERIVQEAVELQLTDPDPIEDEPTRRTMPKRVIETYSENGVWKNKVQGSSRAANTHPTKAAALKKGREMARARKVEHIIRNKNGTFERNGYDNVD
jgi:uncharacterized protein DUF2188